jgi:hypothetical protein
MQFGRFQAMWYYIPNTIILIFTSVRTLVLLSKVSYLFVLTQNRRHKGVFILKTQIFTILHPPPFERLLFINERNTYEGTCLSNHIIHPCCCFLSAHLLKNLYKHALGLTTHKAINTQATAARMCKNIQNVIQGQALSFCISSSQHTLKTESNQSKMAFCFRISNVTEVTFANAHIVFNLVTETHVTLYYTEVSI